LYRDEKDFRAFLFIVMDVCKDYQVEIISYCLMSNHYHLLLRTQTTSISIIMARINKHYADYYNNRHQVSGHLYEKPFYSKPVYDSVGLLEVSRYIHLNPIEANITVKPQNYRWSSFQYYYSIRRTPIVFLTLEPILEHFTGKTTNERKRQYCQWVVNGRTSGYSAGSEAIIKVVVPDKRKQH
jgi:putative transposase